MRRQCLDDLQTAVLQNYKTNKIIEKHFEFPQMANKNQQNKVVVVSENSKVSENFDAIVFAPTIYSLDTIKTMQQKFKTQKPVYLSVPALMDSNDESIINKILAEYPQMQVYGNNISAFGYNRQVFASPLMNISNSLSAYIAEKLGATNICLNFEASKDQAQNLAQNASANIYVYSQGHMPLMTFAHCPMKNNFEGNCKNCMFDTNITYALQSGQKLMLSRYKMAKCYFNLKSEKLFDMQSEYNKTCIGQIFDKT